MPIVVVPAKPLARAKARLSGVLSPAERRTLCLAMLSDVCAAAGEAAGEVWVVASDDDAAAAAGSARVIRDPTPTAGLNASLEAVIPASADGVLILSSDLPAASADDVRALIGAPGVTLAPDTAGTGTNALWRDPAGAIPLAFGERSREAHEKLAADRGVPFRIVVRDNVAFDVDLPRDLASAWEARIGEHTRAALSSLGFPERAKRLA